MNKGIEVGKQTILTDLELSVMDKERACVLELKKRNMEAYPEITL
jgi:hypothetical protein